MGRRVVFVSQWTERPFPKRQVGGSIPPEDARANAQRTTYQTRGRWFDPSPSIAVGSSVVEHESQKCLPQTLLPFSYGGRSSTVERPAVNRVTAGSTPLDRPHWPVAQRKNHFRSSVLSYLYEQLPYLRWSDT